MCDEPWKRNVHDYECEDTETWFVWKRPGLLKTTSVNIPLMLARWPLWDTVDFHLGDVDGSGLELMGLVEVPLISAAALIQVRVYEKGLRSVCSGRIAENCCKHGPRWLALEGFVNIAPVFDNGRRKVAMPLRSELRLTKILAPSYIYDD